MNEESSHVNGPHAHSAEPEKTNDQLIETDLIHEKPDNATEINVILSRRVNLTYRYRDRLRSRTLLVLASSLACLILVVLPGIFVLFIKPTSAIVTSIFFIPVALSLPYIFYFVYRLSIQGTGASAEASPAHGQKLRINFAREGKELAGWGGALAVIGAILSAIIEFVHF